MQNLKRLLLLSALGVSFAHSSCLSALLRSSEFFAGRPFPRFGLLHTFPVRLSSAMQEEILFTSPRTASYRTILNHASDPLLRARAMRVLTLLEVHEELSTIENYEAWLAFLRTSPELNLHHRIFEGLAAGLLLQMSDVNVTFEPRRGFFFEPPTDIFPKSMDLRLTDRATGKVIAYREIKHARNLRGVLSGLGSSFAKAVDAQHFAGPDVELSATIFIDREIPEEQAAEAERSEFNQALHSITPRLQNQSALANVLIVHTGLGRAARIWIDDEGFAHTLVQKFDPFAQLFDPF